MRANSITASSAPRQHGLDFPEGLSATGAASPLHPRERMNDADAEQLCSSPQGPFLGVSKPHHSWLQQGANSPRCHFAPNLSLVFRELPELPAFAFSCLFWLCPDIAPCPGSSKCSIVGTQLPEDACGRDGIPQWDGSNKDGPSSASSCADKSRREARCRDDNFNPPSLPPDS